MKSIKNISQDKSAKALLTKSLLAGKRLRTKLIWIKNKNKKT